MSLPTNAIFYDSDNKIVQKQFVNVGWFVTDESLYDVVINDLFCVFPYEYVILYGMKVMSEIVRDCKTLNTIDQKYAKEYFLDNIQKAQ